ncbi:hypothetical protein CW362_31435 [Streptomyces populi]|uniref:DUF4232 domain-containing protein n=1 Tax=Streptomyces populi TaxID=2058924 RepID=A0A2I0SGP5_9ACTN|nr:DUF4232 domain-containing protein [Streptomyces populi]PKT69102.1 hypothetical protein CW362_31435 [Streptomyces populi]
MSARTTRTRLLAATTVALAALALSACDNGKGVRSEGPGGGSSTASGSSARPASPTAGGGTTAKPADTGTGTGGSAGRSHAKGSGSGTGSTGGATGGSAGKDGAGSKGGSPARTGTRNVACDGSDTRTTATVVSRPLNHLLLTVTNTGTRNCDLTGYPIARFGEAQSVPPVAEETHPQAVVTLAPGESGYAGVLLSAADGSGGNGYTAKTLEVGFDKGRGATPALPAKGVHVDDRLTVTYWQQSLDDALGY